MSSNSPSAKSGYETLKPMLKSNNELGSDPEAFQNRPADSRRDVSDSLEPYFSLSDAAVSSLSCVVSDTAGAMLTKEEAGDLSANWRKHENASRVKLWMDSHAKFAMDAEYLAGIVAPGKPFGKAEQDNFTKAFDQHIWSVDKHSDFEEKKIFPYFQEKTELKVKLGPKELHHEHTHWRESIDKIRKVLSSERIESEQAKLHSLLIDYGNALKKHMREEEDDILRPWLEMSTWDYTLFFGGVFIKMITSPFQ